MYSVDFFTLKLLTYLLATYLIASIPFGLLIGKIFAKKDVRKEGSGNIGATNVTRIMGKKFGAVVLILDGLKGFIPVLLAKEYFITCGGNFAVMLVAVVAILGHIFSVYLKFKGGKGVATTMFVLFAIDWRLGLCMLVSWVVVYLVTKVSALAALSAILFTTLYSTSQTFAFEYMILCVFLCLLIFARHRSNISRMLNGKELVFKK